MSGKLPSELSVFCFYLPACVNQRFYQMNRINKIPHLITRYLTTNSHANFVESLVAVTDGIKAQDLNKAIEASPELTAFSIDMWQRTHDEIRGQGFHAQNFLSIVTNYPTILNKQPDKISKSLECWRACQFGENYVRQLIALHPELLLITDFKPLGTRVAFLQSYSGTRRNVCKLFINSPNLIFDSVKIINEKIDYFEKVMRIEVPEVVKSCAFSETIEKIKCRHIYLERLGLFKPRSLKADPNESNKNPNLYRITDTSDKTFAVKVAFTTLEEYEVFEELYKRELEHEASLDDEDDVDDDGDLSDEEYEPRKN